MSTTMTIEADETLKKDFDAAVEELLREWMRDFASPRRQAEYNAWAIRKTQIGLAQANAGETLTNEEVEAEAAAWRTEVDRKPAGQQRVQTRKHARPRP